MTKVIIQITLLLYMFISWIINAIQLFNCDFESPYKEEFIKTIGVFVFPLSRITVWF